MGYLVSLSAFKDSPNNSALRELPKSLPWKLYRAKDVDATLLDVFNIHRNRDYPFSSIPAIQDLPLQFEASLAELNDLYESLRKKNRADGFKRAFVNLNIQVSRLLQIEVLSFVSDDEGIDLACISNQGSLRTLRFRAGGVEVQWTEGHGATQAKQGSSLIHRIAQAECKAFLGRDLPIFGFDGDTSSLELEVLDMSSPLPPRGPKPPRGGWAAHERMQRELAQTQRKWWQFWK